MESRHFQLEEIASGIYAAIHKRGGLGICNAGIIDLGDRTLIFDTMLAPKAAVDLSLTAEAIFKRPISMVVNSHYHNDHIWGNQIFSENVDIISTLMTRNQILTIGKRDLSGYKEHAPNTLETIISKTEGIADPDYQNQDGLWIEFLEATVESMGRIRLRIPNLTFESQMIIHGSRRTAVLMEFKHGHTQSDCVMVIPETKVCFTADLVTINTHPYLSESSLGKPQEILHEIEGLNIERIVPGHGPIGKPSQIAEIIDYINYIEELASQATREDLYQETTPDLPMPESYVSWDFGNLFADNVKHYWQYLNPQSLENPSPNTSIT
jgi:glyoxylase-like metal-dependent hydrolase (beta-lactamase superfamily II)